MLKIDIIVYHLQQFFTQINNDKAFMLDMLMFSTNTNMSKEDINNNILHNLNMIGASIK